MTPTHITRLAAQVLTDEYHALCRQGYGNAGRPFRAAADIIAKRLPPRLVPSQGRWEMVWDADLYGNWTVSYDAYPARESRTSIVIRSVVSQGHDMLPGLPQDILEAMEDVAREEFHAHYDPEAEAACARFHERYERGEV